MTTVARGVALVGALFLALGCSSEESPSAPPAGAGGGGGGASSGNGGVVVDGTNLIDGGSATCSITTYMLSSRAAYGDAAADPCEFPLTARAPDPYNIRVRTVVPGATSTTIPPSATDGWSYAPDLQSIVLVGSYCQAATDGTITAITVDYGCGIPPLA